MKTTYKGTDSLECTLQMTLPSMTASSLLPSCKSENPISRIRVPVRRIGPSPAVESMDPTKVLKRFVFSLPFNSTKC